MLDLLLAIVLGTIVGLSAAVIFVLALMGFAWLVYRDG